MDFARSQPHKGTDGGRSRGAGVRPGRHGRLGGTTTGTSRDSRRGTGNGGNGSAGVSRVLSFLGEAAGGSLPVLPGLVTLRVLATPSPYCRPSPLATLAGVLVPVPTDRLLQVAGVRSPEPQRRWAWRSLAISGLVCQGDASLAPLPSAHLRRAWNHRHLLALQSVAKALPPRHAAAPNPDACSVGSCCRRGGPY